jgi:hypothetical protein
MSWFLYTLNIYAHFSSHFSQQLLMAEIWYLVTSFIYVPHIVGSVFEPIRFLLLKKHFPRYGVPIWILWPNIRFLPSIVAEKNATKNEHICSMCIKMALNQDNMSEWGDMSTRRLLFQWSSTIKIQLSVLV